MALAEQNPTVEECVAEDFYRIDGITILAGAISVLSKRIRQNSYTSSDFKKMDEDTLGDRLDEFDSDIRVLADFYGDLGRLTLDFDDKNRYIRDHLQPLREYKSQSSGLMIPLGRVTGVKSLPLEARPVVNLRVQTERDMETNNRWATTKDPRPGRWYRMPFDLVDISVLSRNRKT